MARMIITLSLVLVLSGPLFADDASPDAFGAAKEFAQCAGLFDAMSIRAEQLGSNATAENYHGLSNGAETVAEWILATEHNTRTGQEKTLGDFEVYIAGMIEASTVYILALFESDDLTTIKTHADKCAAINALQAEVVDLLRKTAIMQAE